MPRPKKEVEPVEVEVEDQPTDVEEPQFPTPEEEAEAFQQGVEEFNTHVKSLVRLFFEQEVAALEQRITDLEMTRAIDPVAVVANARAQQQVPGPPTDVGDPHYDVPTYRPGSVDVPDYLQEHTVDDGVPWFRG